MNVSIYEAKTQFSALIDQVETGEEVVVHRRNRPVARIVPIREAGSRRIGVLAGRTLRMGSDFDRALSATHAELFGVPAKRKK
jgi:prevent-host-death family protein